MTDLFPGFREERVATSGAEIFCRVGGEGPPLFLVHGYPQNHRMWHRVAPALAERFQIILPDLRGYGASSKPMGGGDHSAYAKRNMARDLVELADALGIQRFAYAGHDRGGRVGHRLALDHPQRVTKLALLDIVPTLHAFEQTDMALAQNYYHWFFMLQPFDFPERMIANNLDDYLKQCLYGWSKAHSDLYPEAVYASYHQAFSDPQMIHATCEDYRAAASIDLQHDREDRGHKLECPLLLLWGEEGFVGRNYNVRAIWRAYAETLSGNAVPGGHFNAEESPKEVLESFLAFF